MGSSIWMFVALQVEFDRWMTTVPRASFLVVAMSVFWNIWYSCSSSSSVVGSHSTSLPWSIGMAQPYLMFSFMLWPSCQRWVYSLMSAIYLSTTTIYEDICVEQWKLNFMPSESRIIFVFVRAEDEVQHRQTIRCFFLSLEDDVQCSNEAQKENSLFQRSEIFLL